MKGFVRTICVLLGLLLAGQKARARQHQEDHVVHSCEDLPPAELKGTTTLLNPITCDPPVVSYNSV